jgi:hypothetical protein
MKFSKFKILYFFGGNILGPPVWKLGPKILGGPAGAPKIAHPVLG